MNTQELETQARFWQHVDVKNHSHSNECWIWTGAQNGRGYGIASIGKGKTMLAHRFVAQSQGDILTDETVVTHICDNPLCVRPSHLKTADQSYNMIDMMSKGRSKNAKLTIDMVRDIRTKRISRKEFAILYNVSEFTVGDVQRRNVWKWLA